MRTPPSLYSTRKSTNDDFEHVKTVVPGVEIPFLFEGTRDLTVGPLPRQTRLIMK
jgi:hypothetical protein